MNPFNSFMNFGFSGLFCARLMPKFVLILPVSYSLYNIEQNRHVKYAKYGTKSTNCHCLIYISTSFSWIHCLNKMPQMKMKSSLMYSPGTYVCC